MCFGLVQIAHGLGLSLGASLFNILVLCRGLWVCMRCGLRLRGLFNNNNGEPNEFFDSAVEG